MSSILNQKKKLLKECVETLKDPKVQAWYSENMGKKPQAETINQLLHGVDEGQLTVKQALQISLLVGYQWDVNFERETTT